MDSPLQRVTHDPYLLAHLWPADRVLVGLRVSRAVRAALLFGAQRLALCPPLDPEHFDRVVHSVPRLAAALVRRFANPALRIDIDTRNVTFLCLVLHQITTQRCPLLHARLQSLSVGNLCASPAAWDAVFGALQNAPKFRRLLLRNSVLGKKVLHRLRHAIAHSAALQHSLEVLDLSGCALTSGSRTSPLGRGLGRLSALRELHLRDCQLSCSASRAVFQGLAALSSLRTLNLSGNTLVGGSDSSLADLCAVLERNQLALRDLRLGYCMLPSLSPLLPGLAQCARLEALTLSFNGIDYGDAAGSGVDELAVAVAQKLTRLHTLDMRCNALQCDGVQVLCVAMAHAAEKRGPLRLYFDDNYVQDGSKIGAALRGIDVVELTLGSNPFAACGVDALVSAMCIARMSALQGLRLSGVGAGVLADTSILQKFQFMPHMRTLDLGGNRLQFRDICDLLPVITAHTKQLRRLSLSNNPLGLKGVAVVAELLRAKHSIEDIMLSNCRASTAGCLQVLALLREPPCRLREVDLRSNNVIIEALRLGDLLHNTPRTTLRRLVLQLESNDDPANVLADVRKLHPGVIVMNGYERSYGWLGNPKEGDSAGGTML